MNMKSECEFVNSRQKSFMLCVTMEKFPHQFSCAIFAIFDFHIDDDDELHFHVCSVFALQLLTRKYLIPFSMLVVLEVNTWHLLNRICPWHDISPLYIMHKCVYNILDGRASEENCQHSKRTHQRAHNMLAFAVVGTLFTRFSSFHSCLNECWESAKHGTTMCVVHRWIKS